LWHSRFDLSKAHISRSNRKITGDQDA
jgi:hypothetical protein